MPKGSSIINTTSVTAYQGNGQLLDYSATKGAIVAFTRSLSASLAGKEIRVNGVAPGPIWTPLAMSSYDKESNKHHGEDTPLQSAGEPVEVAPSYLVPGVKRCVLYDRTGTAPQLAAPSSMVNFLR